MHCKLASGNSNTPQSADSGNAIVRVIITDQQAASASSVDTNALPSTNGENVSSNPAYHDSTSVVSQTINSGVCTNVIVTSEEYRSQKQNSGFLALTISLIAMLNLGKGLRICYGILIVRQALGARSIWTSILQIHVNPM